jgi:hypothetical protein
MKLSEYYKWLILNWSKVGPILSIYFAIFLFIFVLKEDFIVFLILLQAPLYMIHQLEEHLSPGGFPSFFNRNILKIDKDDEPIGTDFTFYVNVLLIWIILPLFGLLSLVDYQWGLWIVYFSVVAGINHIGLAIQARKLYNPGLVVSLLLNIPVSLWMIFYFFKIDIISSPFLNWHFVIGLAVNLLIALMGVVVFKKYKNKQKVS